MLTKSDKCRINSLKTYGNSRDAIAEKTSLSRAVIDAYLDRGPQVRVQKAPAAGPMTDGQRRTISSMSAIGFTAREIAEELNRTTQSVVGFISSERNKEAAAELEKVAWHTLKGHTFEDMDADTLRRELRGQKRPIFVRHRSIEERLYGTAASMCAEVGGR